MCIDKDYQLKIIQNAELMSYLQETLSIHKQNEKVLEQAFWALRTLCSTGKSLVIVKAIKSVTAFSLSFN